MKDQRKILFCHWILLLSYIFTEKNKILLWLPLNKGSVMPQSTKQLKSYQDEGSYPEPSQPTHLRHTFPYWRTRCRRSSGGISLALAAQHWEACNNIFCRAAAFLQRAVLSTSSHCRVSQQSLCPRPVAYWPSAFISPMQKSICTAVSY